jgi:hypothetical protein
VPTSPSPAPTLLSPSLWIALNAPTQSMAMFFTLLLSIPTSSRPSTLSVVNYTTKLLKWLPKETWKLPIPMVGVVENATFQVVEPTRSYLNCLIHPAFAFTALLTISNFSSVQSVTPNSSVRSLSPSIVK